MSVNHLQKIPNIIRDAIRGKILSWYDQNRRTFPWRAEREQVPNPYYVYLSEVMLQQTTVATVDDYFRRFIKRWPDLKALSRADLEDILVEWQGLGYYSRARNLHKSAKLLADFPCFPQAPEELMGLPGVGDYTAAAVASIAFDYPIIPIDGNIMRVFSRLFTIDVPFTNLKREVLLYTGLMAKGERSGDFAQSLMDLGSMICRPTNPKCDECPLQTCCQAFLKGETSKFPVPKERTQKLVRFGIAYVLLREGQIFLEKRPEKGLLGGMTAVPTTPWLVDFVDQGDLYAPEKDLDWAIMPRQVKHTFTHFHLHLTVKVAVSQNSPAGIWAPLETLETVALPTLMKKVIGCVPIVCHL